AWSVNEDVGTAEFHIYRHGDTNSAFTVNYSATDIGSAVPGVNFIPTNGTVSFAAGQREAAFRVPILDNGVPDLGGKSFSISLTDPTGGVQVGGREIGINDAQWPTTLDLDYRSPLGDAWIGLTGLINGPNGQLLRWDGTELVRLNADDSIGLRTNLNLGTASIENLFVQSDYKILILLRDSEKLNGVDLPSLTLVRLNANGSVDQNFSPEVVPISFANYFLLPLAKGRLLIHNGASLAVLLSSGQIDPSFQPYRPLSVPLTALESPEGKLIIVAELSRPGVTG